MENTVDNTPVNQENLNNELGTLEQEIPELVLRILKTYRKNTGSTCILRERLIDMALAEVGRDGAVSDQLRDEIRAATDQVQLGIEKIVVGGQEYCGLDDDFSDERRLLEFFNDFCFGAKTIRLDNKDIERTAKRVAKKKGVKLTSDQLNAVKTALTAGISVLSGGPGSGKTFVIDTIIRVVESLNKGAEILLAAPTGKAAQRLQEATGRPAKTVWRMLGIHHEWELRGITGRKLSADLVIVDEASMLDLAVTKRLFNMLAPSATLVLVGDSDQIPSVSPGAVLRDFEQSGAVQTVRLKNSFRQVVGAEEIMSYANAVKATGCMAVFPFFRSTTLQNTVHFVRVDSAEDLCDGAASVMKELHANLGYSYKDIQVLSPAKENSSGTQALNKALAEMVNPGPRESRAFLPGDRVVCTKNCYVEDVMNGQIGEVLFLGKNRHVTVRFDRGVAELTEGNLSLAYALTVHKAQGSQYPVIVLVLHQNMGNALSKAVFYTALTRAQEKVVVVGSVRGVMKAMTADRNAERMTLLAHRLQETDALAKAV